jgi:hypothetical protein
MARLPRPLWKKVLPDLTGTPYHPTMSWFVVDGFGFDRAYFDTKRWVTRQRVPKPYPWAGSPGYFHHAFDQGVGRALWFIHGGRAADLGPAVRAFAPARHADLWSGVGLAATFAGGSSHADLEELRTTAGEHGAELSLGSVLAAKARHYSGSVPGHTVTALAALAGMDVEEAVRLADRTEVTEAGAAAAGSEPAYEIWRRHIRDSFEAAVVSHAA